MTPTHRVHLPRSSDAKWLATEPDESITEIDACYSQRQNIEISRPHRKENVPEEPHFGTPLSIASSSVPVESTHTRNTEYFDRSPSSSYIEEEDHLSQSQLQPPENEFLLTPKVPPEPRGRCRSSVFMADDEIIDNSSEAIGVGTTGFHSLFHDTATVNASSRRGALSSRTVGLDRPMVAYAVDPKRSESISSTSEEESPIQRPSSDVYERQHRRLEGGGISHSSPISPRNSGNSSFEGIEMQQFARNSAEICFEKSEHTRFHNVEDREEHVKRPKTSRGVVDMNGSGREYSFKRQTTKNAQKTCTVGRSIGRDEELIYDVDCSKVKPDSDKQFESIAERRPQQKNRIKNNRSPTAQNKKVNIPKLPSGSQHTTVKNRRNRDDFDCDDKEDAFLSSKMKTNDSLHEVGISSHRARVHVGRNWPSGRNKKDSMKKRHLVGRRPAGSSEMSLEELRCSSNPNLSFGTARSLRKLTARKSIGNNVSEELACRKSVADYNSGGVSSLPRAVTKSQSRDSISHQKYTPPMEVVTKVTTVVDRGLPTESQQYQVIPKKRKPLSTGAVVGRQENEKIYRHGDDNVVDLVNDEGVDVMSAEMTKVSGRCQGMGDVIQGRNDGDFWGKEKGLRNCEGRSSMSAGSHTGLALANSFNRKGTSGINITKKNGRGILPSNSLFSSSNRHTHFDIGNQLERTKKIGSHFAKETGSLVREAVKSAVNSIRSPEKSSGTGKQTHLSQNVTIAPRGDEGLDMKRFYTTKNKGSKATRSSKRQTRSQTRGLQTRTSKEVVEISSDDDNSVDAELPSSQKSLTKSPLLQPEVARIAIGPKVFKISCGLIVRDNNIELSFLLNDKYDSETRSHCIDVKTGVIEMKFFQGTDTTIITDVECSNEYGVAGKSYSRKVEPSDSDEEEIGAFIALRVKKDERNKLKSYRNYVPENLDLNIDYFHKSYIVIEFRNSTELQELIDSLASFTFLNPYFSKDCQIPRADAKRYVMGLTNDTQAEAKKRLSSRASMRKMGENKLILVYPFEGNDKEIDRASEGLIIPNDDMQGYSDKIDEERNVRSNGNLKKHIESFATEKSLDVKPLSSYDRKHYLTITSEDMDRLESGEYLNDTIIDFWMQWMSRKENLSTSPVHIFSTHFFTTLKEEGIEAVTKWTARKNINIFEKRFVYIPINGSLHWSLCVVTNPSAIRQLNAEEDDSNGENGQSFRIIFLDSLKMHNAKRICHVVIQWICSEFKRLHPDDAVPSIMKSKTYHINPHVPYQTNACDCGVFVCRYAFGLYKKREQCVFGQDLAHNKHNFVSDSEFFDFNMDDIAQLREEIKKLIGKLSVIYLKWKEAKDRENKEKKQEKIRSEQTVAFEPEEEKRSSIDNTSKLSSLSESCEEKNGPIIFNESPYLDLAETQRQNFLKLVNRTCASKTQVILNENKLITSTRREPEIFSAKPTNPDKEKDILSI